MTKITKEMTLHKAIKANPNTIKVFDSYGMGCKSCSAGQTETVEWGAQMHGVEPGKLLRELNAATGKAKKK